jgi:hypothetical protein
MDGHTMNLDADKARTLLGTFDFARLFTEELGWDRLSTTFTIAVAGTTYALRAVGEKRGMAAVVCEAPTAQKIPDRATRRKIEQQVARTYLEHLVIFTDAKRAEQIWCWARRETGKPATVTEHFWYAPSANNGATNTGFLQKLQAIAFSLVEEDSLTLVDVTSRARSAFDVERVTKRFYDQFKAEHTAFLGLVSGITDLADREWYASLMLNRLMFIYFMQRKGFLNQQRDYLRERLAVCQREKGRDKFYSFYRYFLLRLFHEGLGGKARNPELEKVLGRIPYLNGGLFEKHPIEERYPDIKIPDEAFTRIFAYFDRYQWHLDERPLRKDDEINPDVLGYIFEKYINQKQMGAYYTKEDITEYISKSTIIPFLFDAAKVRCKVAFENSGGPTIWDHLKEDPDRYIFQAVRHGVEHELPAEIAAGVSDISARGGWNSLAPPHFAQPKEIWREVIARRSRHQEVRAKLAAGEVRDVNDLITLNLDIRQFVQDVIERCEGPDLLRAFWKAIEGVTVLDPTCGSGAFLFAALNILEPLYETCLSRMEAFVADLDRTAAGVPTKKFEDFRTTLAKVRAHPNARYFTLKSIILNNLFGVDIMEEAVEICKLRLFLKLAAQVDPDASTPNLGIEPLPDMDFNIRAGNTLVGYETLAVLKTAAKGDMIKLQELERVERLAADFQQAANLFRDRQMAGDASVPAQDKQRLRDQRAGLEAELNRHLCSTYGVKASDPVRLANWAKSHEPFHWFVEFNGIIARGGFDAIVGNPPYVATSKISYLSPAQKALAYPDIYALVMLRSLSLLAPAGRCGMIVPLSLTFSEDFGSLRDTLRQHRQQWFSSFDNIPAAVFSGVSQRCTIWLSGHGNGSAHSTAMYRWRAAARPNLVASLKYTGLDDAVKGIRGVPKVMSEDGLAILNAITKPSRPRERQVLLPGRQRGARIGFTQAARNFVSVFREDPPCLSVAKLKAVGTSQIGEIQLADEDAAFAALAALLGEFYFHYWLVQGDGFHVTAWMIKDYVACLNHIDPPRYRTMSQLGRMLHARRHEALVFKKNAGKYVGNFNYRPLHAFTRRSDLVLMAALGVTPQESLDLFNGVQRVLAINAFAGEKGIPAAAKAVLCPLPLDSDQEARLLAAVDADLRAHYGLSEAAYEFLLHRDVILASADGEEEPEDEEAA